MVCPRKCAGTWDREKTEECDGAAASASASSEIVALYRLGRDSFNGK
jgi:hypothetical protein